MTTTHKLFAFSLLGLILAACGQNTPTPSGATTDKVTAQRLAPICPVSDDPNNPPPSSDPDCPAPPTPTPVHHIQTLDELGRLSAKGGYVAYVMRGGMGILGVEKGKYFPAQQALHDNGFSDSYVFSQSQPYSFINWSSNSCSTPKWITILTANYWNRVFGRACELHDFGYNNVGPLSSDSLSQDSLRNEVDAIFHGEMMAACRGQFITTRPLCNLAADGYYQAVRSKGAQFWTMDVSNFTWNQ